MKRLLINGIAGQMGQALLRAITEQNQGFTVVAGVDIRPISASVPVYASAQRVDVPYDMVIDFSTPKACVDTLRHCESIGCPIVIGTTGLSKDDLLEIHKASIQIPVFHSSNMSLGVNLQIALVKTVARALGLDADIEIIEKHHNQKVDAPSGTAWMLANEIAQSMPEPMHFELARCENAHKRDPHEIGIHSIRGGTIAGEHEVMFMCRDEAITIKHEAFSKRVFATGALRAAIYLAEKPAGLYTMQDLVSDTE
ncbi:MAG: 4-hydroxy-tetrahydrodipicolinate reductase [Clostridiales bacterium]|nr:4-hydroxy-tetrahydrodipicolinate reductase [Clostridiales bacterium]